jgi:hypothetical protein
LIQHLEQLVEYALEIGEVPTTAIECLAGDIFKYRKVCTICMRMLAGDSKHFASHPKTRDGFQSYCRDCGAQQRKRYKPDSSKTRQNIDYVEPDSDYRENLAELDYREPKYG